MADAFDRDDGQHFATQREADVWRYGEEEVVEAERIAASRMQPEHVSQSRSWGLEFVQARMDAILDALEHERSGPEHGHEEGMEY